MASAKDIQVREQKDLIAQLNITVRSQNDLIESLKKERDDSAVLVKELTEKVSVLQEQIDYLTKKLFGTSSEKSKEVPGQLNIFNEAELEYDPDSELKLPPELFEEEPAQPRKKKRTRAETFKGIPVHKVVISLPDEEKICPECGTEMVRVGEEYVRSEFQFTPAKGKLIQYYHETYKCPVCTEGFTEGVEHVFKKSQVPEPLLPKSFASPSLVAWIMYQKYVDAVPLYRQESDWKQFGVHLLRATMANWMIRCADMYFRPLYDYLHRELLKRQFAMADETRIQVLKEKDRDPQTDSWMWLFRSGEDGLPPIMLFKYTETRKKANAIDFLKGFSGYLMSDGYQGYNDLPGIKRCTCYAHIRRYFMDAVPKGKELDYSNPAVHGVLYCNRLFEFERYCDRHHFTYKQRKAFRDEKARPILESFIQWLHKVEPRKGTRLDKAVNYALNLEGHLMTYLEDGRCSLHNNPSENEIHPFTTGRKNWLFAETPNGADASALIYSVVESAKANGLNIYQYLNFLLERRPSADMTDDQFAILAPWSEEVKARCSLES